MYITAVISNRFVEITQQSVPPLINKTLSGGRKPTSSLLSEHYEANRKTSINRARKEIRRLLECNFSEEYAFITLTFGDSISSDITNIDVCNKKFTDFKKRMAYYLKRNGFQPFKYIGVTEFQDHRNGSVHYHLVCNLTSLSKSTLGDLWDYGWVDIKVVNSNPNENEKLSNYLKKGIGDPRLIGKKKYLRSKFLFKSQKLVIQYPKEMMEYLNHPEQISLSKETYNSPLYGDIQYETFYSKNAKELMNYAKEPK